MFLLIHSNVWIAPVMPFGFRYFVSLMDDASRLTWIYLLQSKDEIYLVFECCHA